MISLSHQFRSWLFLSNRLFRLSVLGLALSCSACATVSQTARLNPAENGPVQAIYEQTSKPAPRDGFGTKTVRRNSESDIQQLSFTTSDAGVTRIRKSAHLDQTVDQAVRREPTGIQQAQWVAGHSSDQSFRDETNPCPVPGESCPVPVECCQPEPRWPAAGPNPLAAGMMACDVCNLPSTETYADEYLCDGGDRDVAVHYGSAVRRGLETEDTILEFTDATGKERVLPSNKVCIYAPRFASVRTVSRPYEESTTDEVAGVGQMAAMGGVHTRLKASHNVKREMTGRLAVRSRASGLETDALQGVISQLRSPSVHDKLLNIYQSLTFVRFGRVDDSDSARLNYGIQASSLWSREEYPVISAKTDMVLEGHFEEATAVITAIDEKTATDNLRIVKLADKNTAVPGDTIQFTIRYDNLGGREVHHIRIVDNLTPRLQYVEDSTTSDRNGRLVLEDNGEGSQILIWELEEPLPGKTGGVITFKTLVR